MDGKFCWVVFVDILILQASEKVFPLRFSLFFFPTFFLFSRIKIVLGFVLYLFSWKRLVTTVTAGSCCVRGFCGPSPLDDGLVVTVAEIYPAILVVRFTQPCHEHALQVDGNLLDASSFAAYTALNSARIPKVCRNPFLFYSDVEGRKQAPRSL